MSDPRTRDEAVRSVKVRRDRPATADTDPDTAQMTAIAAAWIAFVRARRAYQVAREHLREAVGGRQSEHD